MKKQDLERNDVFWLWWVLSPQLVSAQDELSPVRHNVVNMQKNATGLLVTEETFPHVERPRFGVTAKSQAAAKASTVVRHYHVQHGHWYYSFSMILLVVLLIILIPIAIVIAFWVVISLFVNQNLFMIFG